MTRPACCSGRAHQQVAHRRCAHEQVGHRRQQHGIARRTTTACSIVKHKKQALRRFQWQPRMSRAGGPLRGSLETGETHLHMRATSTRSSTNCCAHTTAPPSSPSSRSCSWEQSRLVIAACIAEHKKRARDGCVGARAAVQLAAADAVAYAAEWFHLDRVVMSTAGLFTPWGSSSPSSAPAEDDEDDPQGAAPAERVGEGGRRRGHESHGRAGEHASEPVAGRGRSRSR